MNINKQLANQFREVQLNGTWIAATNLKDQLSDVTWQMANTKIGSLNTIADLAFHINYYIAGVLKVLEGGTLDIKDKYSFDRSPITSSQDWEELQNKIWADAEKFAVLVEEMPEEKLWTGFVKEQYGNYYRNIQAMIEHSYYHLGQIVILKKMIVQQSE